MKPKQLNKFNFLAGLRACGLAGLRACGLAGALLLAIVPSAWAQCAYFDTFKNNGDGTVTDPRNGTIWQRCVVGQNWNGSGCFGGGKKYPWWDAMSAAKADRFLSKNDWRLPTKEELELIVGNYDDCKNTRPQRGVSSMFQPISEDNLGQFWSSSSFGSEPNQAWYVYFNDGYFSFYPRDINLQVRLVRVGQLSASSEFSREFAKIVRYKESSLAEKRKGEIAAQQSSQNLPSQQRSGEYEFITQAPRNGEIATWVARCRSGGEAVVTKRNSASSVCFYRNSNTARCDSIGVEAAMRKACAD